MEHSFGDSGRGPVTLDLRSRMPGQAVISELLRSQAVVPPRKFLGRLFGASPLTSDTEAWYKGALGEREVGRLLARLGPEFVVLHAVPVGKGTTDIDHVVIGPPGVFTLNTKNHGGKKIWAAGKTLMINGTKVGHIHNSAYEGKRAAELLSTAAGRPMEVTALLVVVGALEVTTKDKAEGVEVLESARLLRWLARRPRLLSAQEIAHISALAARPEVWHVGPPDDGDPAELALAFTTLHKQIQRSRWRRALWVGAAMVVIAVCIAWAAFQAFAELTGA